MSLTATARAGLETAFRIGHEFVKVGTYLKRDGNPTYDPASDAMATDGNVIPNVRYLEVAASVEEREGSPVSVKDAKFLVPAVDLPNLTPGENDLLVVNNIGYNVLLSKFVPGEVVHIIFARRA